MTAKEQPTISATWTVNTDGSEWTRSRCRRSRTRCRLQVGSGDWSGIYVAVLKTGPSQILPGRRISKLRNMRGTRSSKQSRKARPARSGPHPDKAVKRRGRPTVGFAANV